MNRILHLSVIYPKACLASVLSGFDRIPGFRFQETRAEGILKDKEARRLEGKPLGWAQGDKSFSLRLLNLPLLSFVLKEGEEVSAHHFYFRRSVRIVADAIRSAQIRGIRLPLERGKTVFEPGCGTGRFLFYLYQKYGMKAQGADIYEPAVRVGRQVRGTADVSLLNEDLVFGPYLESIPDRTFDMVLISSHLAHVAHFREKFPSYLDRLLKIGQSYLVIEKDNADLRLLLESKGLISWNVAGVLYAAGSCDAS